MGAGASIEGFPPAPLPARLDEELVRKLAGERFDQARFDKLKNSDGNVTKHQFLIARDEVPCNRASKWTAFSKRKKTLSLVGVVGQVTRGRAARTSSV
jgi:hypothetical protein